jgi:ERCC4-type nuclease
MIIVDSHEVANNPEIEATLNKLGIEYEIRELRFDGEQIGDYTNDKETFLVERKKKDFWNVKHTIEQLEKMKQVQGKKYLFIEGTRTDLEDYLYEHKRDNMGRIHSWGLAVLAQASLVYDVEVCFFKNLEEMFKHMYWLDRESRKDPKPFFIKPAWKGTQHLTLLCAIRKLGPSRATILLDKFGSPLNIFLATDEELMEIKGIGEDAVKRIREYTE